MEDAGIRRRHAVEWLTDENVKDFRSLCIWLMVDLLREMAGGREKEKGTLIGDVLKPRERY
jgi:hypothetical protein